MTPSRVAKSSVDWDHCDTFYTYVIESSRWKRLRGRLIRQRGHRCESCGYRYGVLQLHHRNYERLGFEWDSDIVVLCLRCHRRADTAREADALYEARLDGWASKKYGDGWAWNSDSHNVDEEFEDWLERHTDD